MTMESGISNMWNPVTHTLGHFLRSPHTTNKPLLDVLVAFDAAGEWASWAFKGKPDSTALEIGWNMDSRMECTQN